MTFCPSSKTSIPPFFLIAITRFSTLSRLTGADTLLFWKCTHFVCGPCTIAHYISVKPLLFHLLPPPPSSPFAGEVHHLPSLLHGWLLCIAMGLVRSLSSTPVLLDSFGVCSVVYVCFLPHSSLIKS